MLKKFKSLFVIEEEDTSSKKAPSESTSGQKKDLTPLERPVIQVSGTGKGQVQDKFLDVLFSALQSSNQEGFDYLEFKDFLQSSANIPMDDSMRIKFAFANAQTMGATKEKILTTAREYIRVLGSEEAKFQEALNAQRDKNLTGKHNEIKKLEHTIQEKEAHIEKLKAEMEEHRKQIGTLEQEINGASEKLTQTASDFEATYRALLGQIETDVKNIEAHL
jgi:hypothetical protein